MSTGTLLGHMKGRHELEDQPVELVRLGPSRAERPPFAHAVDRVINVRHAVAAPQEHGMYRVHQPSFINGALRRHDCLREHMAAIQTEVVEARALATEGVRFGVDPLQVQHVEQLVQGHCDV